MNWQACNQSMTDERCYQLSEARGIPAEFFLWLRDEKLVGICNNAPAFPIYGSDGEVAGCHVWLGGKRWIYKWFVVNKSRHIVTALVLGDPKLADWASAFESQWDAFAVAASYGWHEGRSELAKGGCIITRGAEGGERLAGLLPPPCCLYAWKQNDPPTNNGRVPAADKWMEDVSKYSGCKVLFVATPNEHNDPNDWLNAGAPPEYFIAAVEAATPVEPPATQEEKRRQVPPDWAELGLVSSGEQARKPFPTHALPPPFCDMGREVAKINRVPEGLAAIVTLAAISACLGVNLSVRLFQNLLTRGNLYLLGVVDSGEGKSVTFTPLFGPFMELQIALRDQWRREVWPNAKARKDTLKKQVEHLQGKAKNAKSDEEVEQHVARIAAMEVELDRLETELRVLCLSLQ